jgi:hypothetical protein
MIKRYSEPNLHTKPPEVCPKPGCRGTLFIPHEDGWQCFNCMKIMYQDRQTSLRHQNSKDNRNGSLKHKKEA